MSTPTRGGLDILLVEDNPDDAEILQELLADADARELRLVRVGALRPALRRLGRERFDLVLLDLSLPDSQGLDTVRRTVAEPGVPPIVVLTGLEDEALGAAAVQAGAQDYVVKGQADGGLLVRAMRYAVERHRLLAERTEDARVWAALARAGEELLDAVTRHALLERLCQVCTEIMGCQFAGIWMLDEAADAFRPAAASSSEDWEAIRELEVPRLALRPFIDSPAPDGAGLFWVDDRLREAIPEVLARVPQAASLVLTLRRSGALVGTVVCGWAQPVEWTTDRQRIARGIVHLAALALENARLVEELEQSNTIKTYFAATMSHELRNTLFAIGGFSEMLGEMVTGAPESDAPRMLRAIGDRARESLQLIQAALELTRSEVRPLTDSGVVPLNELLAQLTAEVIGGRERDGLVLEWTVADALPPLRTDPVKLKMILKNLLGNAVKFTQRGTVRLAVTGVEGGLVFEVSDTGIGIEPAELTHLFEPFRQAHGALSRRAGGSGLGLYIVARLVDLLGGTIAVDSAPGRGTAITVTLPCTGAAESAAPEPEDAPAAIAPPRSAGVRR